MMREAIFIVIAYLIGSIPTGFLLAKYVAGVDVREYGSGNIGATNVTRILGKKLGALTLLVDVLKGFLVVCGATFYGFPVSFSAGAVLTGNCFSLFLKGRGGKGVATSLGVCLALSPLYVGVALATYSLFFGVGRVSAAGSLAAAISVISLAYFRSDPHFYLYVFMAAMVIFRHSSNIKEMYEKFFRK